MSRPTLVLLPGMHGTATMWPPFLNVVPGDVPRRIISFPTDEFLDFDALLARLEIQLRDETDMVLLGESFSGPLALMFGAKYPGRVRTVILSGSFVMPPLPSWLRVISRPVLFRAPLPGWFIRFGVAGWGASDELVNTIRRGIREPTPAVLAFRGRCVLTVNCVDELKRCRKVVCLIPTRDHMVWRWNLNPIVRASPDTTVIDLDGPHLILQARPQAAWEAIRPFLTQPRDE